MFGESGIAAVDDFPERPLKGPEICGAGVRGDHSCEHGVVGDPRLREFLLAVGRECCAERAGVAGVRVPAQEPSVLESADESGHPAGGEHRRAGEIGHPQLVSGRVVQRDEDVELGDRDPVVGIERVVEFAQHTARHLEQAMPRLSRVGRGVLVGLA